MPPVPPAAEAEAEEVEVPPVGLVNTDAAVAAGPTEFNMAKHLPAALTLTPETRTMEGSWD